MELTKILQILYDDHLVKKQTMRHMKQRMANYQLMTKHSLSCTGILPAFLFVLTVTIVVIITRYLALAQ